MPLAARTTGSGTSLGLALVGVTAGVLLAPGATLGEDAAAQLPTPSCVACRADVPTLREGLEPGDWEVLRAGDVLAKATGPASDGKGRSVTALGIVPASPAQVWAVVTDWEAYPRFLPNTEQTRVVRVEGSRVWLSQHLRLAFTDVRYGTVWTLEPERGVGRFALDPDAPHDVAALEGSWQLAPLGDGAETFVRYAFWVDTGRPVPGFVQQALTRLSLPGVVRGVRDEVSRRYGRAR
jgi:ribosome-associated toxin RatA of RatAB toxin-antitoxin module